ncbi:MAG: CapA family protein [Burkholderiaceae bacterium]|nr:CapA family protein [Burkholderiaceae bacterium]
METQASVTMMLTGDVMTGRGIDQVLGHAGTPGLYESYVRDARDYVRLAEAVNGPIPAPVQANYIWGEALAGMARIAPDLRIINLETAVTTAPHAWSDKGINYRMHPDNVDCLTAAHIDCCVLANNHVLDWGREGLEETLRVLRQAGLHTAGAGSDGDEAWAPAALPLDGGARLLVFACCTSSSGIPAGWSAAPERSGVALLPDLSDATARLLADDVARQRAPGDLVLISIHWGGNWGLDVPSAHRDFAHRLIDLGAADIVHGHSSHHPMPVEVYRSKLILYGCGDLINDYEGIGARGSLRSDVGCLYFATLALAGGHLQQLDIIPFQLKRFRLSKTDPSARSWLQQIFSVGGYSLAPLQIPLRPKGWSLRWVDKD